MQPLGGQPLFMVSLGLKKERGVGFITRFMLDLVGVVDAHGGL
jgi:hypothetical protein